jgi:hypothetical protein
MDIFIGTKRIITFRPSIILKQSTSMRTSFFMAAIAALIMGCGPSTQIERSFKEPSSTVTFNDMKKVLVVSFAQSESARMQIETQVANMLQGRGVPSYSYKITSTKGADPEEVSKALDADGFDGALVMRLVEKEKETNYVPGTTTGPYYGGFRGYYGYGYGAYSTPGYYVEDKIYHIETNVYDLKADKLVWSAMTATTNPNKMEKTVNEIVDVLAKQMRKDGFLK